MEEFVFFNQRLTDNLNAIFKYPLTIVQGSAGVGKSFAIKHYLAIKNEEVIWHVIKEKPFSRYIKEFMEYCGIPQDVLDNDRAGESEDISPSDAAVIISLHMRKNNSGNRFVYVLEYMGSDLPHDIVEFLFFLSNQRVPGLHIIVTLRHGDGLMDKVYRDNSVNYISEDRFLLEPREIGTAFKRRGITLGTEEMQWFFLLSGGYIPIIKAIYDDICSQGKQLSYPSIASKVYNVIAHNPDENSVISALLEHRFIYDNGIMESAEVWGNPVFDSIRKNIDAFELDAAFLELPKIELKESGYSPEADTCIYIRSILYAMSGKAKASFDLLKESFWLRVRNNAYDSAWRILNSGLQIKIFLGDKWYEEEKELIECFAEKSVSGQRGIAPLSVATSLWNRGEYHKLIALLDNNFLLSDAEKRYEELLLGGSYNEIGYRDKAYDYLMKAAMKDQENNTYLPSIMFFYRCPGLYNSAVEQSDPEWYENLRKKTALFRQAMKKNHDGHYLDMNRTLTTRESEIAELAGKGLSNKEVAGTLNISENTVKSSLKSIYRKLGIESRKDL